MIRARFVMLLALLSTSTTLSLTGCCKERMEKAKKEAEARQKQRVADIQAYYKDLAAVAAAAKPAGQLKAAKCDDAVIAARKKKHAYGGRLLTVDHEFLTLLTAAAPDEARKKDLAKWEWLRSQELQRLKHPDEIDASSEARWILDDIEKAKKLPFFGVVRTKRRAMPVVPEDTDDFTMGEYEGWIVVVDQETKKALCQVPFVAGSSKRIKYKEGTFSSEVERARAAAKEDFRENFEAATNRALEKISSHLRVKLGLFQL